jgi:hypothetical protein
MKYLSLLLLFAAIGCAALASSLGLTTQADLDTTTKTIHEVGSIFGPYGELVAAGVSAALIGSYAAYQKKTEAARHGRHSSATAAHKTP